MKPGRAFFLGPRLAAVQIGSWLHLQLLLAIPCRFFAAARTSFFLFLALFSRAIVPTLLFIVARVGTGLILCSRLFDLDLRPVRQRVPAGCNHRIPWVNPSHDLRLISA